MDEDSAISHWEELMGWSYRVMAEHYIGMMDMSILDVGWFI